MLLSWFLVLLVIPGFSNAVDAVKTRWDTPFQWEWSESLRIADYTLRVIWAT